ncbi:MerR family transcriptional regulator [Bacillus sp. BRMEA1]|uniref:MerR family transcriptional regulator n=1 Tax=Neobacillus endophyticus TaxID=2738405 RepID=UPI001564FCC1|nr:MerR family transcriptional regulator [Neobacillus endophyticus]NRD78063.1 MerR family transcriptional regulator [Neobacillus endophyticus]
MPNKELYEVMTIDAVSRQLGITSRTLRYYEEVGLISPVLRSSGGHRLFDQNTIERLRQILQLKDYLGISLQEIQEVMDAEDSIKELRLSFQEKVDSVDEQRLVVKQYIAVLHNLIDKMNKKIDHVLTLRDMYQDQVDRSILLMEEVENK